MAASEPQIQRVARFQELPLWDLAEKKDDSHLGVTATGILGQRWQPRGLAIPYWSIILAITLLSAYLLSKPRVAKPVAVTESRL